MKLSDDLVQRIETALEPIDGETAHAITLGRKGRIAMASLKAYLGTQEVLESEKNGAFGMPLTHDRRVAALTSGIEVELTALTENLRTLSGMRGDVEGFDPSRLASLADEVEHVIGPQSRARR